METSSEGAKSRVTVYEDGVLVVASYPIAHTEKPAEGYLILIPRIATSIQVNTTNVNVTDNLYKASPARIGVTWDSKREEIFEGFILARDASTGTITFEGRRVAPEKHETHVTETWTIRVREGWITESPFLTVEVKTARPVHSSDESGQVHISYRLPPVKWSFVHDLILQDEDSFVSQLTTRISTDAPRLAMFARKVKRLGFIQKRLQPDPKPSVSLMAMRQEGDSGKRSDREGAWWFDDAQIVPHTTATYLVSKKTIHARRRIVFDAPSRSQRPKAIAPTVWLDLDTPETQEQLSSMETGRLIVRLADGDIVTDEAILQANPRRNRRICLDTFPALSVTIERISDNLAKRWHHERLRISNRSADTLTLEVWQHNTSKVELVGDGGDFDTILPEMDTVERAAIAVFTLKVAPGLIKMDYHWFE